MYKNSKIESRRRGRSGWYVHTSQSNEIPCANCMRRARPVPAEAIISSRSWRTACHGTYIGLALYLDGAIQCIQLGTRPASYPTAPSDRENLRPIHWAVFVAAITRPATSVGRRGQAAAPPPAVAQCGQPNYRRRQTQFRRLPLASGRATCAGRNSGFPLPSAVQNTLSASTPFPDNENGIWRLVAAAVGVMDSDPVADSCTWVLVVICSHKWHQRAWE